MLVVVVVVDDDDDDDDDDERATNKKEIHKQGRMKLHRDISMLFYTLREKVT